MSTTLADRLRSLVDAVYDGSTNAAAAAIGVPQPTLHKILAGTSESPRAHTLQRIAEHFETSMEWLLTGSGRAPEPVESPTETARLLDSLGLTARAKAQVLQLSILFQNVDEVLGWQGRIGDQPRGVGAALALYGKQRRRGRLVDEAIAATLEAFILRVGRERACERLEDPEVGRLLVAIQHPLDLPGFTREESMTMIAAQAVPSSGKRTPTGPRRRVAH